jgi:hypothetical protein
MELASVQLRVRQTASYDLLVARVWMSRQTEEVHTEKKRFNIFLIMYRWILSSVSAVMFRVIVCRITIGLLTSATCHNGCNNLIINKKDISRSAWVSGRILSGFLESHQG